MGACEHVEPVTLDYARGREPSRFTLLEKTLILLLATMASFALIVVMRPSFVSGPGANVVLTKANMGGLTSPPAPGLGVTPGIAPAPGLGLGLIPGAEGGGLGPAPPPATDFVVSVSSLEIACSDKVWEIQRK